MFFRETLMSRGPGRVQSAINELFTRHPDRSYTIEELCELVYGETWIEKRHRVAVLRAAKSVAKRHPDMVIWRSEQKGGTLIFVNHRNVMSYGTAFLKGMFGETDTKARRTLREDDRYAKMIEEGGHWWRHVQEWIAEQDCDVALKETLRPLQEAAERESAAAIAALRQVLRQRTP